MTIGLGLGLLGGVLLLFSYFGNIVVYATAVTEEKRPNVRTAYLALSAIWFLLNLGIVALLIRSCFV